MIEVVHVITDLYVGGAETMLHKLVAKSDRSRFSPRVVALAGTEPVGPAIEKLGIPVTSLGMRHGVPDPIALMRLTRLLRSGRPDAVQTWMYHADLIGGLAARRAGVPVVWGIHQSNLERRYNKRRTLWTVRACARLSRNLPARIVCCSQASARAHARIGYDADKMTVIPNGFDLDAFTPDPTAGVALRDELGVADGAPLVGVVARFDPQKDHRNFVEAAGRVHAARPDAHFVACGLGVTNQNLELARWIAAAGLDGRAHLLGQRADVARVLAALDVAVSSSAGEGFPSVVGEAMCCGVPVVATDVGDTAELVGDSGRLVPPHDPGALSAAILDVLTLPERDRRSLGLAGRERIRGRFALDGIVSRYQDVYQDVVDHVRAGRRS